MVPVSHFGASRGRCGLAASEGRFANDSGRHVKCEIAGCDERLIRAVFLRAFLDGPSLVSLGRGSTSGAVLLWQKSLSETRPRLGVVV